MRRCLGQDPREVDEFAIKDIVVEGTYVNGVARFRNLENLRNTNGRVSLRETTVSSGVYIWSER